MSIEEMENSAAEIIHNPDGSTTYVFDEPNGDKSSTTVTKQEVSHG